MSHIWKIFVCVLLVAPFRAFADGPADAGDRASAPRDGASASADRAAKVAKAEALAREAFANDHYYFILPGGVVDPAQGGIPSFAIGVHQWEAYRGHEPVSERKLLERLGRTEQAQEVRRNKIIWGTVAGAATAVGIVAALPLGMWSSLESNAGLIATDVVRGVGVLGGFGGATYGSYRFQRKVTSVDMLFIDVQKLNDKLRANMRAQFRLMEGVPLEEPTPLAP